MEMEMGMADELQLQMADELRMAVPEADQMQFAQLWALHTQLLERGKVTFFLTEGMVSAMEDGGKSGGVRPAADKLW